jgi:hypothetical protein
MEQKHLEEEVQLLNTQLQAIELGFKERLFSIFDAAQTNKTMLCTGIHRVKA